MLTMPKLRLSRPEHRVQIFKKKLENPQRPLSEQERDRVLARIAAAQKALEAPLQLTSRRLDILQGLARFRFMSSHQIIRYLTGICEQELTQQLIEKPWTYQQILRDLSSLHDHRLVIRPPLQDLTTFGPLIYGLTSSGARELHALGFPINAQIDWQLKNSRASGLFTQHTLETTQAMLLIDAACRAQNNLQLQDHHDLIATFPRADRVDPSHLRVTIDHRQEPLSITVVPDRLFAIHYDADEANPNKTRAVFALEVDRGTMDITSKRLIGKASFVRKLAGYYGAFRQDKFPECWRTRSLRVLTITPSEKRIINMCNAQVHSVTQGHANDLFLYSIPERLASHGPFGNSWMARGRHRHLNLTIVADACVPVRAWLPHLSR
jgi:hypothetical protein